LDAGSENDVDDQFSESVPVQRTDLISTSSSYAIPVQDERMGTIDEEKDRSWLGIE